MTGSMFLTRSSRRARAGVLQGCLIALGVAVLLAVIGGIWVAKSWRGWAASGMRSGVAAMVEESDLSEDQQLRITERTDELFDDFENKVITVGQLGAVFAALVDPEDSPLIWVASMEGVRPFIESSDMTPEEQDAAERTIQRLLRGKQEGTIDVDLQTLLKPLQSDVTDESGMPSVEFKDPADVTRADIDAVLAAMKAEADGAEIPDEPFEVDVAEMVDDVINQTVGTSDGIE